MKNGAAGAVAKCPVQRDSAISSERDATPGSIAECDYHAPHVPRETPKPLQRRLAVAGVRTRWPVRRLFPLATEPDHRAREQPDRGPDGR